MAEQALAPTPAKQIAAAPPSVPPPWLVRPLLWVRSVLGRAHAGMAPPFLAVIERTAGMVDAKAMFVAAELGIADHLERGPHTGEELARAVGADADALDRLCQFLVARGLLGRTKDGRFRNNAVSDTLRASHPQSMRDWARFFGAGWHWEMWNHLGHAVRTGQSGSVAAHGLPFFEYLARAHPAAGAVFNRAMAAGSAIQAPLLAQTYDFSGVRRVCDLGGGTGLLLAEILWRYPALEGVVFDLPAFAGAARATLAARGVADRCTFIGGDFFQSVPDGCDLYVLKAVIHDWDDDSCVRILGAVKRAMAPGARVLVIESVLSTGRSDLDQLIRAFDLEMLVTNGSGRERTGVQFAALFARAEFRLVRDLSVPPLPHVLELAAAA